MPTTITLTLYTIDELEGEAKENARNWWRDIYMEDPSWKDEHFKSQSEVIKLVRDAFDEHSQTWDYNQIRNIVKQAEECSITGYCADSCALESLNDILTGEDDLDDAIHNLRDQFQNEWELEMEAAMEDEHVDEVISVNGYTFTENGAHFPS